MAREQGAAQHIAGMRDAGRFRLARWRDRATTTWPRLRAHQWNPLTLGLALEIFLLVIWALLFAHPYLNMDTNLYPDGVDYALQIHFNHVWTRVQECGACAMWNGGTGAGAPAFADLFAANLHPLVIATTWLAGVRNGSKLLLFGIFLMGGLAQWWLAYVMGLSRVPRLWAGALAVVAGDLVGRMQMGWVNAALSTAACALVLPPLILVAQRVTWRATVLLGLTLGFAALAGQGYMQFGLVLTLPAVLILVPWETTLWKRVLGRYVVAGVLALLIAAPFILPFLNALPQFGKAENMEFEGAIHVAYMPLMWLTNDFDFLASKELGMGGYPALYTSYIGWLPLLLGLFGIRGARAGKQWRMVLFLLATGAIALLAASVEPRLFVAEHFEDSWLNFINDRLRSAPMIAGLAVPAVIGIAAVGVEYLWQKLAVWGALGLGAQGLQNTIFRIDLKWLLLIPLVWNLWNVRAEGMTWMRLMELRAGAYPILRALKTPDMQWIAIPPQNFFLEPAMGMGLKIPWVGLPEFWKDKSLPPVFREAVLNEPPKELKHLARIDGVDVYELDAENSYAKVTNEQGDFAVCVANGRAGDINVNCDAPFDGILKLWENSWTGWDVTIDGKTAALMPGRWLQVELPQGTHTVAFRYRPLDVPLGIGLCVIGLILAIYLWFRRDPAVPGDNANTNGAVPVIAP